jgi:hypothetical protein
MGREPLASCGRNSRAPTSSDLPNSKPMLGTSPKPDSSCRFLVPAYPTNPSPAASTTDGLAALSALTRADFNLIGSAAITSGGKGNRIQGQRNFLLSPTRPASERDHGLHQAQDGHGCREPGNRRRLVASRRAQARTGAQGCSMAHRLGMGDFVLPGCPEGTRRSGLSGGEPDRHHRRSAGQRAIGGATARCQKRTLAGIISIGGPS